jgi:hypothetical protein
MTLALPVDGVGDLVDLGQLFPLQHVAVHVGDLPDLPRLFQVDDHDVLRVLEVGGDARGDQILRDRIEGEHLAAGGDRLDAADDRRELHVARAVAVGVEVETGAVRRPAHVDRIAVEVAADLPHVAAADADDVEVADRVRVSARRVAG